MCDDGTFSDDVMASKWVGTATALAVPAVNGTVSSQPGIVPRPHHTDSAPLSRSSQATDTRGTPLVLKSRSAPPATPSSAEHTGGVTSTMTPPLKLVPFKPTPFSVRTAP